ncbi:MAG TPA: hypothetical protein VK472_01045 [Allosphingosinicella sp.]|nr:hypothetical protein [Allosphingosinicella sp.]
MRKIVSATVSAALCIASITPAFAQDLRYQGFEAPKGATATANIRIPLGRETKARTTYGLTFGIGKSNGADLDGRTMTRELRLADLRFTTDGRVKQARVASFDLANLDRDRRMNLTGGVNTTWFIVGAVAAGVAICLLTDCIGGDDDDAVPN